MAPPDELDDDIVELTEVVDPGQAHGPSGDDFEKELEALFGDDEAPKTGAAQTFTEGDDDVAAGVGFESRGVDVSDLDADLDALFTDDKPGAGEDIDFEKTLNELDSLSALASDNDAPAGLIAADFAGDAAQGKSGGFDLDDLEDLLKDEDTTVVAKPESLNGKKASPDLVEAQPFRPAPAGPMNQDDLDALLAGAAAPPKPVAAPEAPPANDAVEDSAALAETTLEGVTDEDLAALDALLGESDLTESDLLAPVDDPEAGLSPTETPQAAPSVADETSGTPRTAPETSEATDAQDDQAPQGEMDEDAVNALLAGATASPADDMDHAEPDFSAADLDESLPLGPAAESQTTETLDLEAGTEPDAAFDDIDPAGLDALIDSLEFPETAPLAPAAAGDEPTGSFAAEVLEAAAGIDPAQAGATGTAHALNAKDQTSGLDADGFEDLLTAAAREVDAGRGAEAPSTLYQTIEFVDPAAAKTNADPGFGVAAAAAAATVAAGAAVAAHRPTKPAEQAGHVDLAVDGAFAPPPQATPHPAPEAAVVPAGPDLAALLARIESLEADALAAKQAPPAAPSLDESTVRSLVEAVLAEQAPASAPEPLREAALDREAVGFIAAQTVEAQVPRLVEEALAKRDQDRLREPAMSRIEIQSLAESAAGRTCDSKKDMVMGLVRNAVEAQTQTLKAELEAELFDRLEARIGAAAQSAITNLSDGLYAKIVETSEAAGPSPELLKAMIRDALAAESATGAEQLAQSVEPTVARLLEARRGELKTELEAAFESFKDALKIEIVAEIERASAMAAAKVLREEIAALVEELG